MDGTHGAGCTVWDSPETIAIVATPPINDDDDNDNNNDDDGDDGEDKDSIHEPKLLTYYARMSEILEITACHYGVLSRSLSRAYVMGNGFRDTCISKEEKGTAIRLAERYNCSH
ncbi:hypothetical protein HZH68_002729 [Vespula germanica]|uniref:Uncharacterized protein n=1 Tax=Vespula germanica TaxID=30212 RepID=A0A834U169_VESGE|nr:hypothetical protein HZH68_002729 [Vespula germanica]